MGCVFNTLTINLEKYFNYKTILKNSVGYSEANCKIPMSKRKVIMNI